MITSSLPTFIPLTEAAAKYAIPLQVLVKAIDDSIVRAAMVNDEIAVADEDVSILQLGISIRSELQGKPIRVMDASEKYNVNHRSLGNWAEAGYIRVLDRGPKLLVLDEGEVQRAAEIFHRARQATGSYVRAGWLLKRTLSQLDIQSATT